MSSSSSGEFARSSSIFSLFSVMVLADPTVLDGERIP